METKGKKILKVVGILMIVFGGIGTAIYAIGILGGGLLAGAAVAEGAKGAAVGAGLITGLFVFGLVWSILELITGIAGVKYCQDPSKAWRCFKYGIAILICAIISGLWTIWINGFNLQNIMSLVMGVILPGLFCYGAKLNQQ